MGLMLVEAAHVRVVCDSCRTASAEVCARRELAATARASAIPRLKKAGWHHDLGDFSRTSTHDEARRSGSGKWYCPQCASQTHL